MAGTDGVRRTSPAVKLTYDDFVLFPDDGQRHELIDGEHYVTPAPNMGHQRVLGTLYLLIASWLETHPGGEVFLSPLDVVLSDWDVVEPDLLYVSAARSAGILTPQNVRGAPDLVVEIASRGTRKRDETIKLRLYERSGVQEYWIVDPVACIVRVYRREGDRFAAPFALTREAGDSLHTPLFPGLDLPLARVFRDSVTSL